MSLHLPQAPSLSNLKLPHFAAFHQLPNPPSSLFNKTSFTSRFPATHHVRVCSSAMKPTICSTMEEERRSANYIPSIWDYSSILSSTPCHYTVAKYGEEIERMKTYVKGRLFGEMKEIEKLELIDAVQRLGLQYHFDAEIKHALELIDDKLITNDLYVTALQFRLRRQHGYHVQQDVFKQFLDRDSGSLKDSLSEDVKGMLSLYEASFLGRKDEAIIDESMAFSTAALKKLRIKKDFLPERLGGIVYHALDMPIHWRPNRLEARWFIDYYKQDPCMDPTLLKLAKLDYNVVQSIHQQNIDELTKWWLGLGLSKLSFFRDRLMEHYLWIALTVIDPQYKSYFITTSKLACLITTIDDCYDAYGTLDELEILTNLIERWDVAEIDRLPPVIRSCFVALHDTINEIGVELMAERGFNVTPYLQKMWASQCKAYLREAKWYHNGVKPTFKEYLNNGVTTIGGFITLLSCFLTTADTINEETLDFISKIPKIIPCCSTIVRLNNDLGSSSYELARGDNLKAIECFMAETGSSEETAREHVRNLVVETWKTMNEVVLESYPFEGPFIDACINFGRASQCFDQHGNCHGPPSGEMKRYCMSVLVQHVPMDDV